VSAQRKILSLSQYAAYREVTTATIRNYLKRKYLNSHAMWMQGGRYHIDPDEADKQLAENAVIESAPPDNPEERIESFTQPMGQQSKRQQYENARTATEVYKAKLAQLEYEEKSGELVRAADIRKKLYEVARDVRNGMMGIASRTAPVLVAMDDQHEIQTRLSEEIATALESLSNALRGLGPS
jgi:hypothetical protein